VTPSDSHLTDQFTKALQNAERTGELEPLLTLFAPEAELHRLDRPDVARGQDGARRFWTEYLSSFETIASRFTNVIEGTDGASLEWISDGALRDGRALSYRGVSVLEFRDGAVGRFSTYYDSAAFLLETPKTVA
jgi:ketosteroid isomerase-like protein